MLFHGHQSDVFNKSGCNWFGRNVTQIAGMFHEVPIAGDEMLAQNVSNSVADTTAWWNEGKENATSENRQEFIGYAQLDEVEMQRASESLAGVVGQSPILCCGHSHDAKFYPGDGGASWGYVNTGTAGMAPQVVWFVVIDLHANQTRTRMFMARRAGAQVSYRLYKDAEPTDLKPDLTQAIGQLAC